METQLVNYYIIIIFSTTKQSNTELNSKATFKVLNLNSKQDQASITSSSKKGSFDRSCISIIAIIRFLNARVVLKIHK